MTEIQLVGVVKDESWNKRLLFHHFMTWIEQPKKSNICGHIAVAVITGKTVLEIIGIVGHKHGTTSKELTGVLRKLGYSCPNRSKKMSRPELGLGQVRDPKRKSGWHWVAVSSDKIYDGSFGNPDGTVNWPDDWKIKSYIPVTKP